MAVIPIQNQTEGPLVVVKSFTNFTKQTEDSWLEYAYRDFLGSLLETAKTARVRFGPAAQYDSAASSPNFIISGSFQRTADNLRVFIEVKDGVSGKILKIIQMDTPYPNNAQFFLSTAEAARQVGKVIDISFTERDFNRIRDATDSTEAFEYYSKGMNILRTYNPKGFGEAKVLFEKTKKTDFRSWLGYQGLVDLYTFQGLLAKQEGLPFQTYYQIAQTELTQMQSLAKRPPAVPRWGKPKAQKKPSGEVKLTNRFLKGNAEYIGGIVASEAGDYKRAAEKLKEATEQVPEDAAAWLKLANAFDRLGKTEDAAKARASARKVNSCI